MNWRFASSRWAAWVFAFALLLKAAMPLLATGSAHAQGKALVEVCTVYGVATVPLDAGDSLPGHEGAPGHGGDHCALNASVAMAGADLSAPVLPSPRAQSAERARAQAVPVMDACAAWMARLEHAPPHLV